MRLQFAVRGLLLASTHKRRLVLVRLVLRIIDGRAVRNHIIVEGVPYSDKLLIGFLLLLLAALSRFSRVWVYLFGTKL